MGIQRCKNGHFYDNELHKKCPYCKNNVESSFIDRTPSAVKIQQEYNQATQMQETDSEMSGFVRDEQKTIAKVLMKSDADMNEQKTVAKYYHPSATPVNEQRTVAHAKAQGKTQGLNKKKLKMDPVVGWLVNVKGSERGRDYRLHLGRNFIGRSLVMDVALMHDDNVASQNHANIVYDIKSNKFVLISISGSNVYVNDEPVLDPIELKSYDRIIVGDTELDFIAYCKGEIKWEEK